MQYINTIKIELLCVIFGFFGFYIAITHSRPEIGVGLTSTAITSYFAFKKTDSEEL
jgi:hypothetical protein